MGAQRVTISLMSALALACGVSALGATIDPGARPVEIAQDTGKYWKGDPTHSKGADGKETWTYPDKSTVVRDKNGMVEYHDPKGTLLQTFQSSGDDTATYETYGRWDNDGNWVETTQTHYRDGHFEARTLVHAMGPDGTVIRGESDVRNLDSPSTHTEFGEGGVFIKTISSCGRGVNLSNSGTEIVMWANGEPPLGSSQTPLRRTVVFLPLGNVSLTGEPSER